MSQLKENNNKKYLPWGQTTIASFGPFFHCDVVAVKCGSGGGEDGRGVVVSDDDAANRFVIHSHLGWYL